MFRVAVSNAGINSTVGKKGLRFAGSVLGFGQFGAVDEDGLAPNALSEP